MSVEALKWAFEQEDVPPGPRFVLVALANRSNEEGGDLYPSVAWIMRKTGIPERNVRKYIDDLVALGCLAKAERRRDDGGRTSNEYRLPLMEPGLRFPSPPAATAGGGVQQLQDPPAATAGHETKEETKETRKGSTPLQTPSKPRKDQNRGTRTTLPIAPPVAPPGVSPESWAGFLELRKAKRAPLTDRAISLIATKLVEFQQRGMNPTAVIDQSIERGWTGVFELKGQFVPVAQADDWRKNVL